MEHSEKTSPREALLDELRGQSFNVPPLQSFFNHLPEAVSQELPQLEKDVDEFLEKFEPLTGQGFQLPLIPIGCFLREKDVRL